MTLRPRANAPVRLRLYIAGDNPTMRDSLECRDMLLRQLGAEIEIVVVDVVEDPQAARSAGILAAPTLSDDTQSPPRRLVGYLGAPEEILDYFDLRQTGATS